MEDLETRLRLLEKYQSLAKGIVARYASMPLFGRAHTVHREPVFSPDSTMTVQALEEAIRSVLAHLPERAPELPKVTVQQVVSIEDMMTSLTERINASMHVSFRDATRGDAQKVNVIVTFLAMLELVRQGVIRVEQEAAHGDIMMRADTVGTPRYI
jgi:chromatin segregation and condensation protein Rec8/ScpA/Scc1 (kleisin family)